MAYNIDGILSDELITVVERDDERGYFALRFGPLSTNVFIHLGRHRTTETTKFDVSHAIHTPTQAGPCRTSINEAGGWEYALHRAVSGITGFYRDAVKAGHKPAESWLVEW